MPRKRFAIVSVLPLLVLPSSAQARTTVSTFSEAINITTDERHVGPIDTLADIGRSIEACWNPPQAGDQVTVRLSFRRDGSIFGRPFVTYRKSLAGKADASARLAASIADAITRCAPLPFTNRLGAAVAGHVFLIRFIAP